MGNQVSSSRSRGAAQSRQPFTSGPPVHEAQSPMHSRKGTQGRRSKPQNAKPNYTYQTHASIRAKHTAVWLRNSSYLPHNRAVEPGKSEKGNSSSHADDKGTVPETAEVQMRQSTVPAARRAVESPRAFMRKTMKMNRHHILYTRSEDFRHTRRRRNTDLRITRSVAGDRDKRQNIPEFRSSLKGSRDLERKRQAVRFRPPRDTKDHIRCPSQGGTDSRGTTSLDFDELKFKEIQDETPRHGARLVDFVTVDRGRLPGRIELLEGYVERLEKKQETDVLIIYVRERGVYEAKNESSLAALKRTGLSLKDLENEAKPEPSHRRHYHCWLASLPKRLPEGFEYKRILVYEDPGRGLAKNGSMIVDIVSYLTCLIGRANPICSLLIPLGGALLSRSMRQHLVRTCLNVSYAWMRMGFPITNVKILLPKVEAMDQRVFTDTKSLLQKPFSPLSPHGKCTGACHAVFSYAPEDECAAKKMISYLKAVRRIAVCETRRDSSARQQIGADQKIVRAVRGSQVFIALLSESYLQSVECREALSLAHCRESQVQGNYIVPIYWKSCELTPLARQLVKATGIDCREESYKLAHGVLRRIRNALNEKISDSTVSVHESHREAPESMLSHCDNQVSCSSGKRIIKGFGKEEVDGFEMAFGSSSDDEKTPKVTFDSAWKDRWHICIEDIEFGPPIGSGGFGKVYRGRHKDRTVAVKTLHQDNNDVLVTTEFLIEIKLMSKIRHPHIVTFLGASIEGPRLAIILEFMQGGSLYRAIKRRRKEGSEIFPIRKIIGIARGVAKGLEHLHSQRPVIIHRDIKSPNVLLGRGIHEVKLSDFGLSRILVHSHVNTGFGGTPEWMAPEMLRQDEFDEKSDVYSFGVVLWEMLTNEKPWGSEHPMKIAFKVGNHNEKLPIPSPDIAHPRFLEMMTECFATDPSDRPTARNLVERLESLWESEIPDK